MLNTIPQETTTEFSLPYLKYKRKLRRGECTNLSMFIWMSMNELVESIRCLQKDGDNDNLLNLLSLATRWQPCYAPFWHDYAIALTAAGRLREAVEACNRTLEWQRDLEIMKLKISILLEIGGDPDMIVSAGRKTINAFPEDVDLLVAMGHFCALHQHYARAEHYMLRAIELQPKLKRNMTVKGVLEIVAKARAENRKGDWTCY
jgi:uncharacterized protein HemY